MALSPHGGSISTHARRTRGAAAVAGPPRIARYIAFWNRRAGTPWAIAAYAEVGSPSVVASGIANTSTDVPRPTMSAAAKRAAVAIASADSDFAEAAAVNGTAL